MTIIQDNYSYFVMVTSANLSQYPSYKNCDLSYNIVTVLKQTIKRPSVFLTYSIVVAVYRMICPEAEVGKVTLKSNCKKCLAMNPFSIRLVLSDDPLEK